MAESTNIYFKGDFTGFFFTRQELPFSYYDDLPKEVVNQLQIYKGELINVEPLSSYESEQYYTFSDLRVESANNIEFKNAAVSESAADMPINNFRSAILKEFKILDTWSLNGKTYGVIKGELIGEVECFLQRPVTNEKSSDFTQNVPSTIPINEPNIESLDEKRGCLTWFKRWWWQLLILVLIIFLLRQCSNDRVAAQYELEIKELREELLVAEENAELRCHASKIFFYGGTDSIIFESSSSINKIATLLERYPDRDIMISGHFNACSAPESDDLAWTLDNRRAKKVFVELSSQGVDSSRMRYQGLDFDQRIVPCDVYYMDQFGKQNSKNMRVEIEFL